MSASIRRPRASNLECKAATRFATRPSLFDAADHMLREQWSVRGLDSSLDPQQLFLVSTVHVGAQPYIRPLPTLLLERYCQDASLNLTPVSDFLAGKSIDDLILTVGLNQVEALINASGPFLLEEYQRMLTAYWSDIQPSGESNWQWCSDYLRTQFETALLAHRRDKTLPETALDVAQRVLNTAQGQPDNAATTVSSLRVDLLNNGQLDPDLGSALLIEQTGSTEVESVTLLYTCTGRLIEYADQQTLMTRIDKRWPRSLPSASIVVHLHPVEQNPFDTQARGLLLQQIKGATVTSSMFSTRCAPMQFALAVDRLTSMLGLCRVDEATEHHYLVSRLPAWLRDASAEQLMTYGLLLTGVAQTYQTTDKQSWLSNVKDAQTFAYDRLTTCIEAAHPQFSLDLKQLRVVNERIIGSAIPSAGSLITDGAAETARFTLAELAIANVGALQAGTVSLESLDGSDIPSWFDAHYLRSLITEADVGQRYPAMLRKVLLDDQDGRNWRELLLREQLHSQLPALAMESNLRGTHLTDEQIEAIGDVFAAAPEQSASWHLRPLGLLSAPAAAPDLPLNVWLIEKDSPSSGPCFLYRPLHAQTLLLFADRQALLETISTPGDLQDDLLERLQEQNRKVYAHGGFLEPHLFHPGEDDWAVPFGAPAPATLARLHAEQDPTRAVYQGCVEETIRHFQAHAQSSDQARWNRWKELGWLLLNSLLPFMPEPLATAGWVVQMEAAFLQLAGQTQDTGDRTVALMELLMNIAMLLYTHARKKIDLERPIVPGNTGISRPGVTVEPPNVLIEHSTTRHDFSFSNPRNVLNPADRARLNSMHTMVQADDLGSPIPTGPLQGLHLYQDKSWAVVGHEVYQVVYNADTQRVRVVDPAAPSTLGPWLIRDEAGRWQLDLRLRLSGGMPLGRRIERLRLANAQALRTLDETLTREVGQGIEHQAQLQEAAKLASNDKSDTNYHRYLTTAETCSTFWTEHLQHLAERNEREALQGYKIKRAYGLCQKLRSEQSVNFALNQLHSPLRAQMLEIIKRQHDGYTLTRTDVTALMKRIDALLPLLDKMLVHSRTLTLGLDDLERLASINQPKINEYLALVRQGWSKPLSPMVIRWMRIEACTNRLTLLDTLDATSKYWMDRSWDNLQLAITQRLQLGTLDRPSEELKVRIIHSIAAQLKTARRQLENLRQHLDPHGQQHALTLMEQDFAEFASDVQQEAEDLPDIMPSISIRQLRRQVPGLIETQEHGLLLGNVRENDQSIVDIPAPNSEKTERSYKLEGQRWVEASSGRAVAPAPSQVPRLKRLLKDSKTRMEQARKQLADLKGRLQNKYLPVEIQELLDHHRARLDSLRESIEQRLTADNETDEFIAGNDAALSVKALEDLSAQLASEAVQLRLQAAISAAPRMSDVAFLLDHGEVVIRSTGPRSQLAKIKGRAADFLDEYAVERGGQALWYAHFHYKSLSADPRTFVSAHLKLPGQRLVRGQYLTDPVTGLTEEVIRRPITQADAEKYFFPA